MAVKVNGSKAVLKGYKPRFEPKTVGRHDGKFIPTEQYGTLASGGVAAVLHPLTFQMQGCTDGDGALGAGAGTVELKGGHKVRCGGREVLLEKDTGSCSGELEKPGGDILLCKCTFRFQNA